MAGSLLDPASRITNHMKRNIHTVPYDGDWAVKKEGQVKPISIHRTKENAEKRAIPIAKKLRVKHVIHGKDGKIQDKDSYGRDPNPPRDKKY